MLLAPDVIIQGEQAETKKYSLVLMIAIYQDLVLLVQTEQKNGIGYKSLVSSTQVNILFNGVVSFNDANGKKIRIQILSSI